MSSYQIFSLGVNSEFSCLHKLELEDIDILWKKEPTSNLLSDHYNHCSRKTTIECRIIAMETNKVSSDDLEVSSITDVKER